MCLTEQAETLRCSWPAILTVQMGRHRRRRVWTELALSALVEISADSLLAC